MAKASQVVILENEFYIIKAPNGKVLEVKDFNTENGAAIQAVELRGPSVGSSGSSWTQAAGAGASRTALPAR